MTIKIYDSKARSKRGFVPEHPGEVRMYVCGPTVYNYIHIGNARTFISFDTIRRYLEWRGFKVTFVQNVTDVDDKIIKKANEEGTTADAIAQFYTEAFVSDMRAAGVKDPDVRPKATEEIPAMIELVKLLIERGHAYETQGDVYFDVRSYPAYGELSGRNIDEMESGHRELRADGQGLEDRKRDPLDFALWKAAKPGEPSWESPWGQGRPGWHIECSAMSKKYLDLPFDIHGGGADLCFPHHENERAQSEAAYGVTFNNYWMHGGMLNINNEKMSKSLGNFLLLRDVLETTPAAVLRMLMLQTHYRSPLDFSDERLRESETALSRIRNFATNTAWAADNASDDVEGAGLDAEALQAAIAGLREGFAEAMDDDFNTAGALGCVFTFVNEANALVGACTLRPADAELLHQAVDAVVELLAVLGVSLEEESVDQDCPAEIFELASAVAGYEGGNGDEAIQALLDARAAARKEKNWAVADSVRDGFAAAGFVIEDTPQGARVSRK
ncbi:MAG: cysteine--tRNA ligase [Coriobacteriia bacterium]|nr:cysteine--tRNA ligase [Coriobacteriia bacterium]